MSTNLNQIDWSQIRLVIFDVDGTLYDQSKMRRKMLIELCKYYMIRPWKIREFLLLKQFRDQRDKLAFEENQNIAVAQFQLSENSTTPENVMNIVDKWMRQKPLEYIREFRFKESISLFNLMTQRGIEVAVLSDFHPAEKLAAMGHECANIYSSESKEINVLKPHPKGILHVLNDLKVSRKNAVYIGDREETDGEASNRAGIPFINVRQGADQIYSSIQEQIANG